MKITIQDLNNIHNKFSDKQKKFLFNMGIFISGQSNPECCEINLEHFFKFHGKDYETYNELIVYDVFFSQLSPTEDNIICISSLGKLICLYLTHLYIENVDIPKYLMDKEYVDFSSLIANIIWKKTDDNTYVLDLKKYDGVIYELQIKDDTLALFEVNGSNKEYIEYFDKDYPFNFNENIKKINAYLKDRHLMISDINKKISNMF